jgi:hypothetical protein
MSELDTNDKEEKAQKRLGRTNTSQEYQRSETIIDGRKENV